MTNLFFQLAILFLGLGVNTTESVIIFEDVNEKVFSVSLAEFSGEVNVNIYNWEGEIVYEGNFMTESTSGIKTFNANALPNGKYVFVIADSVKERATPFEIYDGKIDFKTALSTMTYSPGIQQFNNNIHINGLTSKDSNVKVVIEDENNFEIYNQKFKSDLTFGKVLDLSKLPTGFYVVRVSIDEKSYSKSIKL